MILAPGARVDALYCSSSQRSMERDADINFPSNNIKFVKVRLFRDVESLNNIHWAPASAPQSMSRAHLLGMMVTGFDSG